MPNLHAIPLGVGGKAREGFPIPIMRNTDPNESKYQYKIIKYQDVVS
jgi:hypothetical protein